MSQSPPTRRRWFQFGLRELFWLALVVALAMYAFHERRQRAVIASKLSAAQKEMVKLARDGQETAIHAARLQLQLDAQKASQAPPSTNPMPDLSAPPVK
jgi:hypothetical protein